MRPDVSADADPALRPAAICIPPHLHASIFSTEIAAPVRITPRTIARATTPLSMCADRPTPAERRLETRAPRLVPRPAYTEYTPVRLPPVNAITLEPRSARVEHTSVELPPYPSESSAYDLPWCTISSRTECVRPPLVPKAPPPAYEKMPASSEKGGLPLPIPTKAPRPRRSHLQMFALFALIALIAIPLVWLASGDPGLLSRLDTLPFFSAPHTPHRAHRLQPPPSPYRPGFRRPGFRRPGWAPSRTDEVPPLGAEWHARCDALLTVPEGTHSARLDKLANVLGGAVWIAEPGPSVEYFLGAFGSRAWGPSERPFLIAVHGETVTLLTPAFEEARARLITLPEDVAARVQWVAWAESESPYKVLEDVLGRTDVVLDRAVRTFVADGVRHHIHASDTIDMNTVPAAVAAIRERKDAREIGLLRCANEATLHAIRRTRSRMHIGIRESETRAILYEEMAATGLTDNSALILFGPNAALPHGSGTDRRLGEDEFALIDAGGRWGGYVADITRTFFLPDSQIPEAHQWVWEIVRAAQRAPTNLLRLIDIGEPVLFSWLDDRSRETVKKGMAALGVPPARGSKPDYTVFTHRTGHGIGLEGHESPYVVQGDEGERQVLPGHTFTIEPGVYVPTDSDVGDARIHGLGVRLEDTVVVVEREDGRLGVEWLTGPVERWGDV